MKLNLLTIDQLKNKKYLGSKLKIEEKLGEKEKYIFYIASYKSEGLTIYGFLTIPKGKAPQRGWSAILFNHGFIPLKDFKTDKQYVRYVDYLAKAGYVVFKPDYRGHGKSQGQPQTSLEAGYTVDALNALASIKKMTQINSKKIYLWGHSMGGRITLAMLLIDKSVKAAVIWAASLTPILVQIKRWNIRGNPRRKQYLEIVKELGDPDKNALKYQAFSAVDSASDLQIPLQIHHCYGDERLPVQDAKDFYKNMKKIGKNVQLCLYQGGDHNFSGKELGLAMKKSIAFFKMW